MESFSAWMGQKEIKAPSLSAWAIVNKDPHPLFRAFLHERGNKRFQPQAESLGNKHL